MQGVHSEAFKAGHVSRGQLYLWGERVKKIALSCLNAYVVVYAPSETEKCEKVVGDIPEEWNGLCMGHVIWIRGEGDTGDIAEVCIHESVHAVDWVLEKRLEMKQGKLEDNTELRAYLTGFIGSRVMQYVFADLEKNAE